MMKMCLVVYFILYIARLHRHVESKVISNDLLYNVFKISFSIDKSNLAYLSRI